MEMGGKGWWWKWFFLFFHSSLPLLSFLGASFFGIRGVTTVLSRPGEVGKTVLLLPLNNKPTNGPGRGRVERHGCFLPP